MKPIILSEVEYVVRDANNQPVAFATNTREQVEAKFMSKAEAEEEAAVLAFDCDDLDLPLQVVPAHPLK